MTAFDSLSYRKYLFPRAMSQAEMFAAWLLTWGSYGKENTVKNKFFTDKLVCLANIWCQDAFSVGANIAG